jgi:hypothetical protein
MSKINADAKWPFPLASEVTAESAPATKAKSKKTKVVEAPKEPFKLGPEATFKVLTDLISKHGTPTNIGVRGWISITTPYNYNGEAIGEVEEGNKGWIFASNDETYDDEPSYTSALEVLSVAKAIIEDNIDETTIEIETEDGGERTVLLINEESDGKSWDFNAKGDINIYDLVRQYKIEQGEDADEINETDDDDLDINEFLWDACSDMGCDSSFSTPYGVAYANWEDADISVTFETNELGEVIITEFKGVKVTEDTDYGV